MLYNFKTTDDSQNWVIDTEALTWARASSILSTPSVAAAAQNLARFVAAEEGKLAPMGGGRYALIGRAPLKDGKPQLAIIILAHIPVTGEDGKIVLMNLLQANVDTSDGKHSEISSFHTKCLPAIRLQRPPNAPPAQIAPITAEEQEAAKAAQTVPEIEGQ